MAVQNSWKDVRVVILGRSIEGIVDVSYKRITKKDHVRGRGNKSLGIVSGDETIEGKVTILQTELEAMVLAAQTAGKTLTEVSFDIVHVYENDEETTTTDIVVGAEFTEYEKKLGQSDPYMKIELPYMALELKENVA